MSRLALYLLGPPRVYRDGAAVGFDRRKVLALLASLAVSMQRRSRDEMSELLFRGEDRDRARANLRQTLSLLGSVIGEDRLHADRMSVGLAAGRGLWVDVAEYRGLLEKGRAADLQGDLSAAWSSLAAAVKLVRGEFLSGFYLKDSRPFEEWQEQTQETLRGEQAAALERLVEIHGARGEHDQAVSYAQQWLSLDPLEERVHRQLMRLHALAGQRLEALRQYEKCRAVLERELGEKTDEKTENLRELIASGGLVPAAERGESLPESRAARGRLPHGRRISQGGGLFLFARIPTERGPSAAGVEARVRDAIGTSRGRMLAATRQTVCAAFTTGRSAVRAALLARDSVPAAGRGPRIVLLSEELPRRAEDPSSELAHRADLLLEASHPGQILLSEAAAALVREEGPPPGAALRSLGSHRLRDLGPARPIHQLDHHGNPMDFPPLDTLDRRPNNLQVQPTRFIGRAQEMDAVQEALRSEETRLLTLVGVAGTGKTRLALQAAAGQAGRFEEGVFFVDLAALREPNEMRGAIAAALGFQEAGGDSRSLMDALIDYLARRRLLLILDNFEHLLPAATDVATLVAGCPRLSILATSREALRLRAERVIPVPPMRLPDAAQEEEAIARADAVRLFVDRAEAVQPDFVLNRENAKTVAAICARLDGIPLAIELAATHIKTRAPRDLLAALQSRLGLLQGGPRDLPTRQQTLRAEIDWSHQLLAGEERVLFRRASVFPGGCTQEASSRVCRAPGEELNVPAALVQLANKSLFRTRPDGEGRFRMLETIREYARERLEESGETEAVETRFSSFFLDLAEKAEPGMFTRQQKAWFDRIEAEYDNLRAALSWMRDRRARIEGLRLAGALGWFWFRRARFSEGQYWLELFRGTAAADDPPGPRAKVAYWLGWMKLCVGSGFWGNPEGKRYFAESLELFRRAGDNRGAALSLVWLGWKEGGIEDADGRAMADQSVVLARETGDPWAMSWCLKVANSHLRRPDKDLDSRAAALEEAITLARKSGDPFLLSQALGGMGNVYAWIGELARSLPWYLDSLRISREIDDKWSTLDTLNCLGDSHLGLGHLSEARGIFSHGLRMAEELGAKGYLVFFMQGLCGVARGEGRMRKAARLWAAEASILEPGMPYDSGFPIRFGLDEDAARAEWTAGQSMTLDQAVSYALGDE
jgi:predicted ATPase/DNA-binding SARP family transcriptional activator